MEMGRWRATLHGHQLFTTFQWSFHCFSSIIIIVILCTNAPLILTMLKFIFTSHKNFNKTRNFTNELQKITLYCCLVAIIVMLSQLLFFFLKLYIFQVRLHENEEVDKHAEGKKKLFDNEFEIITKCGFHMLIFKFTRTQAATWARSQKQVPMGSLVRLATYL